MIPKRYENAQYDDVPAPIRNAFESMKETRRGLYIHGKAGTGKTHIAYALFANVREVVHSSASFANTTELLYSIRKDFDLPYCEKANTEEELLKGRGVLFLDDFGAEKLTEWALEVFYLVINRRYNEKLPIVFTSNLSPQALVERVGERVASRIVEMCDVFEVTGKNRRL